MSRVVMIQYKKVMYIADMHALYRSMQYTGGPKKYIILQYRSDTVCSTPPLGVSIH